MLISQTMPDEHPPTPLPCRWLALVTLRTLAKVQLVWRRICGVVLSRSSWLFEHTLRPVCALPEYPSCKYNINSYFFNVADAAIGLRPASKNKEMWTKKILCFTAVEREKNITSYEIY